MFQPFSFFIGARYVNSKKKNHFISFISLMSMVGITLGVMVLITVLSVFNGFEREIKDRILKVTPHLSVLQWDRQMQDWQSLAKNLMQHKEIKAVAPYIDGQGMFIETGHVRGALLRGVDPALINHVFPLRESLVKGKLDLLKPGEYGVVLGKVMAEQLKVTVGDKVTLVVPEINISVAGSVPRMRRLTVVGIFEVGYLYDSAFGFLNIEDAAKLFRVKGVHGVQVKLDNPYAAPRVREELLRGLTTDLAVSDWTLENETYFKAVKMEKTMMFLILLLILAVAVFNLVSTLVMVVADKRVDISILRSLGASRSQILKIFIFQGGLVGIIGTLLGVVLGILVSLNITDFFKWLEKLLHTQLVSGDVYFISYLPSEIQYSDLAIISMSALILSFIATAYPAWRATKILPAEALRYAS